MASNEYFSHTLFDGTTFDRNMANHGYDYLTPHTSVGENIAAGNADAAATFTQWQNSPPHNDNMLGVKYIFKAIGIGRAYGANTSYGWYWTATFGGLVTGETVSCPGGHPPGLRNGSMPSPVPAVDRLGGSAPARSPRQDVGRRDQQRPIRVRHRQPAVCHGQVDRVTRNTGEGGCLRRGEVVRCDRAGAGAPPAVSPAARAMPGDEIGAGNVPAFCPAGRRELAVRDRAAHGRRGHVGQRRRLAQGIGRVRVDSLKVGHRLGPHRVDVPCMMREGAETRNGPE
jgi:hypothetical protein